MPLSQGGAAGTPWRPPVVPLFLALCLSSPRSVASCPSPCLCASDIISCSGRNLSSLPVELPGYTSRLDLSHNTISVLSAPWTSRTLERLMTLVLNRNFISEIQENAFAVTPRLTHLDLSSNQLTVLNSSVFSDLKELRELLLFGNYVAQIQPGAFRNLLRLQRLYLSGNMLTQFPLVLYEDQDGPRNLTFLDLSSNRMTQLPVQTLLSLQDQSGIYLQDNPLVCDCGVQALMEYWTWRQYRPLVDFGTVCKQETSPECSLQKGSQISAEVQTYQVEPGRGLSVPCPGFSAGEQEGALVFWVTPRTVLNSSDPSGDLHRRFRVLPNGTLEIQAALEEDSATYVCVAARGRRLGSGESLEVSVVVGNLSSASGDRAHRSTEHFNTAFTTLASCVVSIILVLLYLYLTPCRCGRGAGSRGCGGRAIVICSDPREVESGQRRVNRKRVAFLDPQVEDCNNGGPKTPALTLGHVGTEGILKNGSRTVGQTLTDTAHTV